MLYIDKPVRSLLTQLPDLDVFVATGNLSGGARITNNIVLCFSLHRFEVNTKLGLQGHPFTMQADKAWYCKLFCCVCYCSMSIGSIIRNYMYTPA